MAYSILVDNQEYRGDSIQIAHPCVSLTPPAPRFAIHLLVTLPLALIAYYWQTTGYWFSILPGIELKLLDKLKACSARCLSPPKIFNLRC